MNLVDENTRTKLEQILKKTPKHLLGRNQNDVDVPTFAIKFKYKSTGEGMSDVSLLVSDATNKHKQPTCQTNKHTLPIW